MKIIGCVNGYDEQPECLDRCFSSLEAKVDFIVYVDGAYSDFPHQDHKSNYQSLQVIKKYADKVVIPEQSWDNEINKRNQYLIGDSGDWYFVLDCDEELIGELNINDSEADYDVCIKKDDLPDMWIYRCFKHREGIRYFGTHHCLWVNGELLNHNEHPILDNCYIYHYQMSRDINRVRRKGIYYELLKQTEGQFRAKYHV